MQEQKQLKVIESPNPAMEAAKMVSSSPAPAPPPLPPSPSHLRRPRVREVSSRFMSPVVSNIQRRPRQPQPEGDLLSTADENRPIKNSETPLPIGSQCKANLGTTQRKQQAGKLFKENGGGGGKVEQQPQPSKSYSGRIGNGFTTPTRPDTPTITVSLRYRLIQQQRSASANATAAAKLLQASGMSMASQRSTANQLKGNVGWPQEETNLVSMDVSSVHADDDRHNSEVNCSIQSLPEFCSFMPEGDMLPTVSTRSVAGNRDAMNCSEDCLKFPASPFTRSICLPSSGNGHLLIHSMKGSDKQVPSPVKQYPNSVKIGGLSLPPVPRLPTCTKPGTDTRKGKKGSSHQDDVHSLRLLYNRYMQWRYANAKAESSMKTQQRESEKALYSLAMKISELRDSVNRDHIELGILQRAKTLSTILEAQIPYLDEWSALEECYSVSLTEVIQAMLNASVQLPMDGNIRADPREVGEALNSALKLTEAVVFPVQRYMSKAEETDISISELTRIVGGERAFVGECGDLLSEFCKSQVEEHSLRGQLLQLYSISHKEKDYRIISVG